jgi:hypothetical protein
MPFTTRDDGARAGPAASLALTGRERAGHNLEPAQILETSVNSGRPGEDVEQLICSPGQFPRTKPPEQAVDSRPMPVNNHFKSSIRGSRLLRSKHGRRYGDRPIDGGSGWGYPRLSSQASTGHFQVTQNSTSPNEETRVWARDQNGNDLKSKTITSDGDTVTWTTVEAGTYTIRAVIGGASSTNCPGPGDGSYSWNYTVNYTS